MKIAVLGTGMVGRAHAGRLVELGHDVVIGTKDIAKTLVEKNPDQMGNPPFSVWQGEHKAVKLGTFEDAAKFGSIVFNALKGEFAVDTLKKIENILNSKILIDITNPLDFSKGMPPSLFVSNTDSLGEQIQKALPQVKVVKTFNTTNALVQVNPQILSKGDHSMFISGNDSGAKIEVKKILNEYGWKNILDLGDITNARGQEMFLPLWVRIFGSLQNPMFNINVVVGKSA